MSSINLQERLDLLEISLKAEYVLDYHLVQDFFRTENHV
jgi:hypothetical protein